MAVAVASARRADGTPAFEVIGIDLPTPKGRQAIEALNQGRFPVTTTDRQMIQAVKTAHEAGNLTATDQAELYARASVIVTDVHLDVSGTLDQPQVDFTGFRAAIRAIGRAMAPGTLVIVETTVPPGTCAQVVAPVLAEEMVARGLPADAFLLAHSFERVMPGEQYFDSIVNFWRVYAGHTEAASDACQAFLEQVINTADFPLTRLGSTTESELTKVMENSYRAVNIAFIDEWAAFAESVGIDLFRVTAAIRRRPTHSNIRQPGFGVGGYCLTKDPLFAAAAATTLFGRKMDFPFCRLGVETNRRMPLRSLAKLDALLDGLDGKRVLVLGISYRSDVGDTRYSPSQDFVEALQAAGGIALPRDPLVTHWDELSLAIPDDLPPPDQLDAIVFAVAHGEYRQMDYAGWLGGATPVILDANDVLTAAQRANLRQAGCMVACIGRGTLT